MADVFSPLAGTVFSIDCEVGQKVEEDDVIFIMDALKMEHEVEAGATGTVKAINVKKGDKIDTDVVMAVIE